MTIASILLRDGILQISTNVGTTMVIDIDHDTYDRSMRIWMTKASVCCLRS